ncbi:MAG: hypothetical protein JNM56_17185, partial [Planctomycetia bacterium]|nr:hypothetical protein [Planctomycetia bacterium]
MSDVVQCPHCPRRLQVPAEVLGRAVQCPSCGQTFTAGVTAPAPPVSAALPQHGIAVEPRLLPASPLPSPSPPSVEDIPWVERVPDEDMPGDVEDWRKVRIGVSLVYYGLAALILTFIFVVSGGGCVAAGGQEAPLFGLIVALVVVLSLFANFALNLVGQIFCLWAPAEHSARGLAIISLVLTIAGPGLTMTGGVVSVIEELSRPRPLFATTTAAPRPPGVGPLISNIGNVLSVFQMLAFLSFLRATALCLKDGELALSVQPVLALAGVMAALFIGILFLGAMGGGVEMALKKLGIPPLGALGIAALLALIFVIGYGRILLNMRVALDKHLLRLAGE